MKFRLVTWYCPGWGPIVLRCYGGAESTVHRDVRRNSLRMLVQSEARKGKGR